MSALFSTEFTIPVWLYRVLAAFPLTGMAGIDHFAIGSNYTGMAKGFVNILTFGSWYVFDVLQSIDAKRVSERGLEIPFYGKAGIGAGRLVESADQLDARGKIFLNILFVCCGGGLYLALDLLAKQSGPVGTFASGAEKVVLAATVGIVLFAINSLFSVFTGAGGITGQIASIASGKVGEVAGSMGMKAPAAMPTVEGVAGNLIKQIGGGGSSSQTNGSDVFVLGTLLLLSGLGFTLSASRSAPAELAQVA
jgi:hypothetical protein